MSQIEVTEDVKKLLDHRLTHHNEMVENCPDSLAAVVGKWAYSDVIMWLHNEVFDQRDQTISGKDFGRLSS